MAKVPGPPRVSTGFTYWGKLSATETNGAHGRLSDEDLDVGKAFQEPFQVMNILFYQSSLIT